MVHASKFQVLSFHGTYSELNSIKKRKFHKKVTSGCLACRLKKVKCDELQPTCARCRRNGRVCEYETENQRRVCATQTIWADMLSPLSAITVMPFSAPSPSHSTPSIHLIQYLWQNWETITNIDPCPAIKDLFQSDAVVRTVLLALSASHLRQRVPDHRPHYIAKLFQQSLAIGQYRRMLEAPKYVLGQKGVNSLFTSAVFLNQLTFAIRESERPPTGKDQDPLSSWLFRPQEDRLNWLVLQTALRPLIQSMSEYITETIEFTTLIFTGVATDHWTFSQLIESLEGVPDHWIEFFGLVSSGSGCDCSGMDDVYRAPATILATVRHLEKSRYNLFRTMQFLGKLQGDFRSLVCERDDRALWLFGYWLGIMSKFRLWWCESLARQDFEAVCLWLDQRQLAHRQGREGQLWKLMIEELKCATQIL